MSSRQSTTSALLSPFSLSEIAIKQVKIFMKVLIILTGEDVMHTLGTITFQKQDM